MPRLFDEIDALPSEPALPWGSSGQQELTQCWWCREMVSQAGWHVDPATGDYFCVRAVR